MHLFGDEECLVNCDDIPGFNDTGMRIDNKSIMESLKIRLAGLERRELDAVLVVQSIAESAINLKDTLVRIERMFGPGIERSIIVIATKSDLAPPQYIEMRLNTIRGVISSKNIPYVLWINDSLLGPTPPHQKQQQVGELQAALQQVQALRMMEMEEYERFVEMRAKQMMEEDKSNIVHHTVQVPTTKCENYTETKDVSVPRVVKKYSDQEAILEAQRLANLPQNQRYEVVNATETIEVDGFDIESKEISVTTHGSFLGIFPVSCDTTVVTQIVKKKKEKKPVSTQNVQKSRADPSEFLAEVQRQEEVKLFTEQQQVERTRTVDTTMDVDVATQRREIDAYKRKVAKEEAIKRFEQP